MDFFYDGQVRRYVTQFMRIFIGFKYQAGNGDEQSVPVMYGDLTRQVANIIRENSENKLPTVPRIACYITSFSLDSDRLSDPTFVSKVHIRERKYTEFDSNGNPVYTGEQGGSYTVERLMPTPYLLTMKADIWTSNTDQKLQLLEQILVLFNPAMEIQTTDNYIDWTSLSVVKLETVNFSSRSIPAGVDSDIDICSLEFSIPVWISPPAKVKKLGIVRSIIANIFTDEGEVKDLSTLVYNGSSSNTVYVNNRYPVLLFKANNGQDYDYDLTIVDKNQAVQVLGLDEKEFANKDLDWNAVLDSQGGFKPGSKIYFKQPSGYELTGTFAVNPIDPHVLLVTLEQDRIPTNTSIAAIDSQGRRLSGASAGTIDAIIDPSKFNPIETYGNHSNIPNGIRYLMLDDVNNSDNIGQSYGDTPYNDLYDGPDAWKNADGNDPVILANSIIEWDGAEWKTIKTPETLDDPTYIQNLRTGIQYVWNGSEWLKSFEGEYAPGYWRLDPDPA